MRERAGAAGSGFGVLGPPAVRVSAGDVQGLLRDRVVRAALLLLVLVALPIVLPLPLELKVRYSRDFLDFPLLLLVFGVMVRRAARAGHAHVRWFWGLMAGAFGFWLVVRSIGIVAPAFATGDAGLLLRDVTYVGFYVSLLMASAVHPGAPAPERREARVQLLLGAGASVFAVGLLVYFSILPHMLNLVAFETRAPSLLLYVVLDLFVLIRFAGLVASTAAPAWRFAHLILVACLVAWFGTDLYEALTLFGVLPKVGYGTPLDLAWLPPLVFAVAAGRVAAEAEPVPPAKARPLSGWPLLLYPLALVGLHFWLGAAGFSDPLTLPARQSLLLVLVGILAALGIGAQRHLERDNARLAAAREEAERRQEHSRRLESIGQLAAGIAHDFNNLLGVVSASADLIEAGLTPDQSELHADVRAISDASRRGAGMVGQLLAYAQRQSLAPRPSALGPLLERLLRSAGPLLGAQVRVEADFEAEMPPVLVDPGALSQILLNLLTNARDAMPAGGTIEVLTRRTMIAPESAEPHGIAVGGSYACLTIRDEGVGMDPATLGRAFEPFFTTKALGKGTGLGLATVFGLARQLGGGAAAESTPGKGTTVRVFLPFAPDAGSSSGVLHAEPPSPLSPSPQGSETILVVDDEDSLRRATVRVLARKGYRVLEARNGVEGLAQFRSHRDAIGLVVSDITMPGMSGTDLRAEIRRDSAVPVLLASGYAVNLHDLGDAVFLQKPWKSEEFLKTVRSMLDASLAQLVARGDLSSPRAASSTGRATDS